MNAIEELNKACSIAEKSAIGLLKSDHPNHVAYTRTSASGTVSNITQKGTSEVVHTTKHGFTVHKHEHPSTGIKYRVTDPEWGKPKAGFGDYFNSKDFHTAKQVAEQDDAKYDVWQKKTSDEKMQLEKDAHIVNAQLEKFSGNI